MARGGGIFTDYINEYLARETIFGKNLNDRIHVLDFDRIVVRTAMTDIRSMTDEGLVGNVKFMEELLGMPASLEQSIKHVYGGKDRFDSTCILRNGRMNHFLLYLFIVVYPLHVKGAGKSFFKTYNDGLALYINRDRSVLYLNEADIGWEFDLVIEFFMTKTNIIDLTHFIGTFGWGGEIEQKEVDAVHAEFTKKR